MTFDRLNLVLSLALVPVLWGILLNDIFLLLSHVLLRLLHILWIESTGLLNLGRILLAHLYHLVPLDILSLWITRDSRVRSPPVNIALSLLSAKALLGLVSVSLSVLGIVLIVRVALVVMCLVSHL